MLNNINYIYNFYNYRFFYNVKRFDVLNYIKIYVRIYVYKFTSFF